MSSGQCCFNALRVVENWFGELDSSVTLAQVDRHSVWALQLVAGWWVDGGRASTKMLQEVVIVCTTLSLCNVEGFVYGISTKVRA